MKTKLLLWASLLVVLALKRMCNGSRHGEEYQNLGRAMKRAALWIVKTSNCNH